MTEIFEPESLTSAASPNAYPEGVEALPSLPPVVGEHAWEVDQGCRLLCLAAGLGILALILAGLLVLAAGRPALPLYVLGG